MPENVLSIGKDMLKDTAYYGNESNWDNGILYIGNYLISAQNTSKGDYSIKANTKFIADYAFDGCTALKSIVIPSSVEYIGVDVFSKCSNLKSVEFEDTEGWSQVSASWGVNHSSDKLFTGTAEWSVISNIDWKLGNPYSLAREFTYDGYERMNSLALKHE